MCKTIIAMTTLLTLALTGSVSAQKYPKTSLTKSFQNLRSVDNAANLEWNIRYLENQIARAPRNDPWLARAYEQLAYTKMLKKDYRGAAQSYEVCSLLPESIPNLRQTCAQQRMVCLTFAGDRREAVKVADEVVSRAGNETTLAPRALMLKAEWQKGLSEGEGGGPAAAAKTYETFLRKAKGQGGDWATYSPSAYRGLGSVFEEAGDREGAIRAYDQFLNLYPKNLDACFIAYERARLAGKNQDWITRRDFEHILANYDTNNGAGITVLYLYAFSLFLNQELKAAEPLLVRAAKVKRVPGDVDYSDTTMLEVLTLATKIQLARGEFDDVSRQLRSFIANGPKHLDYTDAKAILAEVDRRRPKPNMTGEKITFGAMCFIAVGSVAFVRKRRPI